MSALTVPPFESNEYIAVVVRRAMVPGSHYIALAYRRLGLRAPAHAASLVLPSWGILLGFMGALNFILFPAPSPVLVAASLLASLFGIAGIVRLIGSLKARRLLAAWGPPDSLTSGWSGP
jgi:hypothetical protein